MRFHRAASISDLETFNVDIMLLGCRYLWTLNVGLCILEPLTSELQLVKRAPEYLWLFRVVVSWDVSEG
jgi:hypothetical protein